MEFDSIRHNYIVLFVPLVLFSAVVPGSLGNALIREDDAEKQIILPVKLDKALNAKVIQLEPIQKSATCKFGRAIPKTCKCSASVREPICGSDAENYENFCEFECALKCNPRLVAFPGECPKDGGPPKQPRLNFTKKVKKGEDEGTADSLSNLDQNYEDPPPMPLAGQLSRSLGGISMDEYLPPVNK